MRSTPALVVIDVQQGFREQQYWGSNANPAAISNISKLVNKWRSSNLPIIFVKHNSSNPNSPLHPGHLGNQLEPEIEGSRDVLIQKSVNSAFYGTPDLHLWLTRRNLGTLVICGITTNFCCETTARMAGNLGYKTYFVLDATDAFDAVALDGSKIPATQVMHMTAANLNGEFAQVLDTQAALALA